MDARMGFAALCLSFPLLAAADDWVVRKNASNMNCYVQPATGLGQHAPNVLDMQSTRKAACESAKKLHTDGTESDRCPAYNPNSISECKKDGVTLP